MKIHEVYKCEKCNGSHSIDFEEFLKEFYPHRARTMEGRNRQLQVNDKLSFSPIIMLREYEDARNLAEIQKVDLKINEFCSKVLSVESRIPSNRPNKRHDALIGRFYFEFYCCIFKAIGIGERVCIAELEDRGGYHYKPEISLTGNRVPSRPTAPFHEYIKVFTMDPVDQWIEITDLCRYLSVNPSWFSGHRVYQFSVQVCDASDIQTLETTREAIIECKTTIYNQEHSVLKFGYPADCDQLGQHQLGLKVLCRQMTKDTLFNYMGQAVYLPTPTQLFSVVRLVYYENATKPRIWIRSPGTLKELTNSIADFVPIYSGTN